MRWVLGRKNGGNYVKLRRNDKRAFTGAKEDGNRYTKHGKAKNEYLNKITELYSKTFTVITINENRKIILHWCWN